MYYLLTAEGILDNIVINLHRCRDKRHAQNHHTGKFLSIDGTNSK